jgi:hypothetical protein
MTRSGEEGGDDEMCLGGLQEKRENSHDSSYSIKEGVLKPVGRCHILVYPLLTSPSSPSSSSFTLSSTYTSQLVYLKSILFNNP